MGNPGGAGAGDNHCTSPRFAVTFSVAVFPLRSHNNTVIGKIPMILAAVVGFLIPAASQAPWLHDHRPRLPQGRSAGVDCLLVDLDLDGQLDLVRASALDLGVWMQDHGGRFERASLTRPALTGQAPEIVALAAGSVTQPSHPDIIVGFRDGHVLVYPNTGGTLGRPSFLPGIIGSINPALCGVFVGDVDQTANRRAEIVLTLNQERPVVFRWSGGNTFQQTRLVGPVLRVPRCVLADIDGDSDLDLVCVSGAAAAPAYPAVYLNDRGSLSLDTRTFRSSVRVAASQIVVADVLGAGGVEIVLARAVGTAAQPWIFQNTSTAFGRPTYSLFTALSFFAVQEPVHMIAADGNGDGLDDLFAIDASGAVVCGMNSTASPGSFRRAHTLLAAAPRTKLCAGDLESDKDVDLLALGAGIEDSLLLGGGANAAVLARDTESWSIPIGASARNIVSVADVTGEGDPDIVLWDDRGSPALLQNVQGQARFIEVTSSRVPKLPASSYSDVRRAAIRAGDAADLLVLGKVSAANLTGVRVLIRSGNGALIDESGIRWQASVKLASMTVADVSGAIRGSGGTRRRSDIVGLDDNRNIVLVINTNGVFSKSVVVSPGRARVGSEILVADVNLDSLADIVVLQPSGPIRVLLADSANPDSFVEIAPHPYYAVTGVLEDLTGDLIPDLCVSVPGAGSKVRLLRGDGAGGFVDETSTFMPRLGTTLGTVTQIATIGSTTSPVRSVVLGFEKGFDRILLPRNGTYGEPGILPLRGSTNTRRLVVADLDVDGDDDLVVARYDTLPALLTGQWTQFTHGGGIVQKGREALLRVAVPDSQTLSAIAIGFPTVRFPIAGMGLLRLARISVMLSVPGPSTTLVQDIRLPIPSAIGSTPIPMQLITVRGGRVQFGNLELFVPTDR